MTILEKSEASLIFVVAILLLLFGQLFLPDSTSVSHLILYGAAVLLLQGLIRDLCLLFFQRFILNTYQGKSKASRLTRIESVSSPVKAQCLCMESAIGLTGVVIGLCFLALDFNQIVVLNSYAFAGAFSVILMFGFFLKDYVFGWNPWNIYKEPDHMNVIFQWKS